MYYIFVLQFELEGLLYAMKTFIVTVRFDAEELSLVDKQALEEGMTRSAFIRSRFQQVKRTPAPSHVGTFLSRLDAAKKEPSEQAGS